MVLFSVGVLTLGFEDTSIVLVSQNQVNVELGSLLAAPVALVTSFAPWLVFYILMLLSAR